MLKRYDCSTPERYKNALKEIIQEIALLGLFRGGLFDKAAFYGETALRIFYGINRFSQDLDFSLLKPDKKFTIDPYSEFVENELSGYGFCQKPHGHYMAIRLHILVLAHISQYPEINESKTKSLFLLCTMMP